MNPQKYPELAATLKCAAMAEAIEAGLIPKASRGGAELRQETEVNAPTGALPPRR